MFREEHMHRTAQEICADFDLGRAEITPVSLSDLLLGHDVIVLAGPYEGLRINDHPYDRRAVDGRIAWLATGPDGYCAQRRADARYLVVVPTPPIAGEIKLGDRVDAWDLPHWPRPRRWRGTVIGISPYRASLRVRTPEGEEGTFRYARLATS